MDNNREEHSVITLKDWLMDNHTTEEKSDIITKIDSSLKSYHDENYEIKSFDPKDIISEIDNDMMIKFLSYEKAIDENYVASNIHDAGVLAISIYMDHDLRDHEDFLKMNFDEFSKFVPEGQGPYYRGVIQRNAPVYLNEFLEEKAKRELEKFTKENTKSFDNAAYVRNVAQPMILIVIGFVIILMALILHFN